MHFGFGDRRSKVVTSHDANVDFFTELHWLFRSVDFDFIFGLPIFLNDKRASANRLAFRCRHDSDGSVFFHRARNLNFFGDQDNDYLGLRVDVVPAVWFTDGEDPFIDGGAGGDTNAGSTANVDQFNMEA